jgi:RND family efflux transporter MFP subunit
MSEDQPSAAVKTAKITQTALSEHIKAYGILEAKSDQVLNLSLAHAGLVNQLWVREGQRVEKGARLAEIITSPEARMQYFQAKSAVEYATQQVNRSKRMLSEKLATTADVESATKNLHDSQNALNALVERSQNKPSEILFSPINGIITLLNITQGQRVQSNDSAMLIASENHLVARIGIEPEEITLLLPNTEVTITPVFDNNINVSSKISVVNAMVNPSTHLIDAMVDIPTAQANQLILGTRVLAEFSLPAQSVFTVPRSALLNDDNGYYIFTLVNKIAHKVYVKKGIEQNNVVAVSGDIKENETVVILGNYILEDGMLTRELN